MYYLPRIPWAAALLLHGHDLAGAASRLRRLDHRDRIPADAVAMRLCISGARIADIGVGQEWQPAMTWLARSLSAALPLSMQADDIAGAVINEMRLASKPGCTSPPVLVPPAFRHELRRAADAAQGRPISCAAPGKAFGLGPCSVEDPPAGIQLRQRRAGWGRTAGTTLPSPLQALVSHGHGSRSVTNRRERRP